MRRAIFLLLMPPLLLLAVTASAQSAQALRLRDSVTAYNNAGQFERSQLLILGFLRQAGVTEEDRFHAHLYMSFTYKRVFDYPSVFRYLDSAEVHATKALHPAPLRAMLICQRALAEFDTKHYEKADSLMKQLQRDGMALLDDEHKAKMTMQQGYLRYQRNEFGPADSMYDQALALLSNSSPCDMPMVYGKKMRMYGKSKDEPRLLATFEKSIACADSCGIVKYRMYTLQMMSRAYESMNRYEEALKYYRLMWHEEQSYQKAEHLRQMTQLEELYKVALKEKEIAEQREVINSQGQERALLLGVILLLVLLIIIALFWIRQRNLLQTRALNLQYTRELFEGIEDERKRISADLHDSLGHRLLTLRQGIDIPDQRQQLDQALEEIRIICRNLHPALFESLGLVMALENLAERMQRQFGLIISLDLRYAETLSTHSELQLYRIVQEALSNVVRHSGAMAAKVELMGQPSMVRARIMDSGRGFKVKETLAEGRVFGLHTILLRCRALGGNAHFQSEPGRTILEIQLPKDK